VWCEALGDTPVVCGVGSAVYGTFPQDSSTRTDSVIDICVKMAHAARDGGASGLMLYPPTALRELPDVATRVVELHRAVGEVGLPLIVFYLYENAGGVSYSHDTIAELLSLDAVIGIKLATLDSVMTYQDIASVVRQQDEVLLITGEDRFLGYSLTLGANAALIGMAAACTDRPAALLDAWFAGDLPEFVRLSASLDAFSQSTFREPMDGYVQRMLWALEADAVIPAGARDPFGPPLDETDRELVEQAVRALRSE
jgi:4-hydroxy-tetrahydrodipicolinate synthase